MLLKQLPTSDAKTVIELLRDVKRAILEEPKRADMRGFIMKREACDGGPSCGTAGCFAGWVILLAGKTKEMSRFGGGWPASDLARQLLGNDLDYMFYVTDGRYHVFNNGFGDGIHHLTPGTRAYARAVVKRIDGFIARNKAKLPNDRLIGRV